MAGSLICPGEEILKYFYLENLQEQDQLCDIFETKRRRSIGTRREPSGLRLQSGKPERGSDEPRFLRCSQLDRLQPTRLTTVRPQRGSSVFEVLFLQVAVVQSSPPRLPHLLPFLSSHLWVSSQMQVHQSAWTRYCGLQVLTTTMKIQVHVFNHCELGMSD